MTREAFLLNMDNITGAAAANASNIAVAISGGIDSAAIAYHAAKHGCTIGITACFGDPADNPTLESAKKVAEFFKLEHHVVQIEADTFLHELERIQWRFREPRYNVWPVFLARKAKELGCTHLFTGEGADEIFGYPDRGYLAGWAGQICYVNPSWEQCCQDQKIELVAPFLRLVIEEEMQSTTSGAQFRLTPPFQDLFSPPGKLMMREIYEGLIPDEVVDAKAQAPSNPFYTMLAKAWNVEFKPGYENFDEVRRRLMAVTCQAWLVFDRLSWKNRRK